MFQKNHTIIVISHNLVNFIFIGYVCGWVSFLTFIEWRFYFLTAICLIGASERQQQAEQIRQWRPWQRSTGARTIEGKAKASHNAFKGELRQQPKELNQLLRGAKRVIDEIDYFVMRGFNLLGYNILCCG